MGSVFTLPHLPSDGPGSAELFSFNRAALVTLGSYQPGQLATVFDPVWTGARFPNAIVEHEGVHQSLTINTTFGYFTQLVYILARRGLGGDALSTCHRIQWTVQELAATYCELAVVAESAPEQLATEISRLPSSRNRQPPYREAIDAVLPWLPLEKTSDRPTIRAMAMLVKVLASSAMNTDCLRRASKVKPNAEGLLSCMADEPNARLETLIRVISERGKFPALVAKTRAIMAAAGKDTPVGPALYKLVRTNVRNAIAWEKDDLPIAVSRFQQATRDWLGNAPERVTVESDPLPKFGYGAERAREEMRRYKPEPFAAGTIRGRAAAAAARGQALIIELALRDPTLAHVKLGAYIPAGPTDPWPAENVDETTSETLPPDITGLAPPETILRELDEFPTVPRIVSLLHPGFEHFLSTPNARDIFRNAIRVCRLTELSEDQFFDAIRRFEGLGSDYVVLNLSAQMKLGCVLSSQQTNAFLIFRLTSDPAVALFVTICEQLGFKQAAQPDKIPRSIGLLSMMGRF